jgi:hypothetical protein
MYFYIINSQDLVIGGQGEMRICGLAGLQISIQKTVIPSPKTKRTPVFPQASFMFKVSPAKFKRVGENLPDIIPQFD